MYVAVKGKAKKMASNWELSGNKRFPCPVCALPREVRVTKKRKPYLICDPCGVQLFIRGPAGIAEFNRLIEQGERSGLSPRISEMESRFRLTCPECGNKFWAERKLIKTSCFDGSFKGFVCPVKGCGALVPW
jgi:transcription elongation factor Elf1